MEKTIVIDGKEVKLKATGGITKRYKAQFQRDLLIDFAKMAEGLKGKKEKLSDKDVLTLLKTIDLDVFTDITWTFAKTANNSIPDPQTWLDSFSEFPIMLILPELQELLEKVLGTTAKKTV